MAAGELLSLGTLHFGRKATQPPRTVLKDFYRRAEHQLEHPILWFDAAKRQAKGDALCVDWVVLRTLPLASRVGDLISFVCIAGVAGMLQ